MAKFRQIHTTFWQDAFVLDLTPEEKYFYVYLMTNSKSSQCGIYELPRRVIETETGYNQETVNKLLQRFIDYDKIIYSDQTKEIMLKNWVKYNFINSPKVIKCIEKELSEIKEKAFVQQYISQSKRLGYGIHTVSIDYGEEEELIRIKEEEKEEEKENKIMAFDFYQNNFGMISGFIHENINYWIDQTSDELVVEAMKRTLLQNKRNFKYSEGILKNWISRNAKTLADVEAMDLEHEKDKVKPKQQKKNTHVGPQPTWMKEPKQEPEKKEFVISDDLKFLFE